MSTTPVTPPPGEGEGPGGPGPSPPRVHPWVVSTAVMIGTFMVVLDTTVVNVSLPHIAGSLSSSIDETTWALTSYLAANAIVLPMTGWLGNHFGRKRILILSLVGFTASSFMCGLAFNLPSLVVFRILQGMSGGTLQPISQAVLLEAFPPKDRGKAMGFFGLGIVVAPILGPVLGGWLTDNYSWRWVFYINVPVGILAVIAARMFVFDPPYIRRTAERVDGIGIFLLAIGIGALQIALDKGRQEDWFASHLILVLFILAVVGLALFVLRELNSDHPIVHFSVFKDRTYSMGVFLTTLLGFVLYGSLVLLPILLQTLWGYPSIDAGIAMAPRGVGSFIAMPVVGLLTAKIDTRKLVVAGLLSGGLTLVWLSKLNLQAGYWDVFWPQLVQGIALSLLFVPLTTITMAHIGREEMGNATSIFNLMRNIGGSIGIAIASTMLANRQQFHRAVLGEHIDMYSPQIRSAIDQIRAMMMARGADAVTATQRAYALMAGQVQRQAAMMAFLDMFWLLGVIFIVAIPLVFLMRATHRGAPVMISE
jgi:DHA2 family multidrug resistance protein